MNRRQFMGFLTGGMLITGATILAGMRESKEIVIHVEGMV